MNVKISLPKWIGGSKCKHHCCHIYNVISTVQIDTLDAPLAVYVGICSILSFYNPPPIVYIYIILRKLNTDTQASTYFSILTFLARGSTHKLSSPMAGQLVAPSIAGVKGAWWHWHSCPSSPCLQSPRYYMSPKCHPQTPKFTPNSQV